MQYVPKALEIYSWHAEPASEGCITFRTQGLAHLPASPESIAPVGGVRVCSVSRKYFDYLLAYNERITGSIAEELRSGNAWASILKPCRAVLEEDLYIQPTMS